MTQDVYAGLQVQQQIFLSVPLQSVFTAHLSPFTQLRLSLGGPNKRLRHFQGETGIMEEAGVEVNGGQRERGGAV